MDWGEASKEMSESVGKGSTSSWSKGTSERKGGASSKGSAAPS